MTAASEDLPAEAERLAEAGFTSAFVGEWGAVALLLGARPAWRRTAPGCDTRYIHYMPQGWGLVPYPNHPGFKFYDTAQAAVAAADAWDRYQSEGQETPP